MIEESNWKAAATRIGISLEEYISKRKQGLLWCCGCRQWHKKSRFPNDKSRTSGRATSCRHHRAEYFDEYYDENRETLIEKVKARKLSQ